MKQSTLQSCWIATLLGLALGATHLQAQNIARGRSFLKVKAYAEAYTEFLKETQLKPQDPEAQTLAGLANFVSITKSDGFNSFLDRFGFDKQGRDLADWTSDIDTEELEERVNTEKINGQELADFIQNELIQNLEKSLNHFKAIPAGKSFQIFLSEDETQISDVFLDQGDVSMIQALIELIRFTLNGVSAQDMHVDIQSILNLLDDEISADAFMSLNPDFMKNVSQNNLKAARASFIGFIDHYMTGSELLQNRSTKHLNHLVSIDEEEEELETDFREHLNHLRFEESLNSLFRIEIKESTVTVSADPVRLFETPLRSLTRVDGLVGVIHQEAEQMATQLDRDIAKLSNISRARIIKPDIDGEGRMSDGADILLLQGDLQLANSLSAVLSAHDLDFGLQEIDKLRNQEKLDVENVLRTNPALLDLKTPSVMPQVRNWLASARQNIEVGYTLFKARKEGKIGVLVPDESLLEEILETLDTILAPEIKTHELSGTFVDGNYLINPNPLWEGKVNIGNLLPSFNANNPMPGTLPDSTIAGLFPDGIFINTESKLEKFRPPYILEQPKNTSAQPGEEVTFSLKVSGPGALEYQWFKNGQVIPDANGPRLVIQNVQEEDYDIYSVWVKNNAGKAYSQIAKLTPRKLQPILAKMDDQLIGEHGQLILEPSISGDEPMQFQWWKDGAPLEGQTKARLLLTDATQEDSGNYWLIARNDIGESSSNVIGVKVCAITNKAPSVRLFEGRRGPFQLNEETKTLLFDFSLDSSQFVTIETVGDPMDDTELFLFDGEGNPIAFNDDKNYVGRFFAKDLSNNSTIEQKLQPGQYTVQVQLHSNADSTGEFYVKLTLSDEKIIEPEITPPPPEEAYTTQGNFSVKSIENSGAVALGGYISGDDAGFYSKGRVYPLYNYWMKGNIVHDVEKNRYLYNEGKISAHTIEGKPDGTFRSTFGVVYEPAGYPESSVHYGKIIAMGRDFKRNPETGQMEHCVSIVRLNEDGSEDLSFKRVDTFAVDLLEIGYIRASRAIHIDPVTDKIYMGFGGWDGSGLEIFPGEKGWGGKGYTTLLRLNSNGGIDTSFPKIQVWGGSDLTGHPYIGGIWKKCAFAEHQGERYFYFSGCFYIASDGEHYIGKQSEDGFSDKSSAITEALEEQGMEHAGILHLPGVARLRITSGKPTILDRWHPKVISNGGSWLYNYQLEDGGFGYAIRGARDVIVINDTVIVSLGWIKAAINPADGIIMSLRRSYILMNHDGEISDGRNGSSLEFLGTDYGEFSLGGYDFSSTAGNSIAGTDRGVYSTLYTSQMIGRDKFLAFGITYSAISRIKGLYWPRIFNVKNGFSENNYDRVFDRNMKANKAYTVIMPNNILKKYNSHIMVNTRLGENSSLVGYSVDDGYFSKTDSDIQKTLQVQSIKNISKVLDEKIVHKGDVGYGYYQHTSQFSYGSYFDALSEGKMIGIINNELHEVFDENDPRRDKQLILAQIDKQSLEIDPAFRYTGPENLSPNKSKFLKLDNSYIILVNNDEETRSGQIGSHRILLNPESGKSAFIQIDKNGLHNINVLQGAGEHGVIQRNEQTDADKAADNPGPDGRFETEDHPEWGEDDIPNGGIPGSIQYIASYPPPALVNFFDDNAILLAHANEDSNGQGQLILTSIQANGKKNGSFNELDFNLKFNPHVSYLDLVDPARGDRDMDMQYKIVNNSINATKSNLPYFKNTISEDFQNIYCFISSTKLDNGNILFGFADKIYVLNKNGLQGTYPLQLESESGHKPHLFDMLAFRDRLLVFGSFDRINGVDARNLAVLDYDGNVEQAIDINLERTEVGYFPEQRLYKISDEEVILAAHIIEPGPHDDPTRQKDVFAKYIRFKLDPSMQGNPRITQELESMDVGFGGKITFSIELEGARPFSFQWMKDGQAIPNQTTQELVIQSSTQEDQGSYSVLVSNREGVIMSKPANLTVAPPSGPSIEAEPNSVTVELGGKATFTVIANGTGTLRYQWLKDGQNIPGATSPALTLSGVTPSNAGKYSVLVMNDYGVAQSKTANLGIISPVTITSTSIKDGYIKLNVDSPPGSVLALEVSTDLKTWKMQFALPAPTGSLSFTLDATSNDKLFYRIRLNE